MELWWQCFFWPIYFVNKYQKDYQLLKHEYGHTIQSLILGPLWIFVIFLYGYYIAQVLK